MGITRIAEIGPREADLQLQRVTRNYVRNFLVETDSPLVGGLEVMTANLGGGQRIPRYGEHFEIENEFDEGAVVTNIVPKQDPECPKVWVVTVTYQSRTSDPAAQQLASAPPGSGGSSGGGSGGSPDNPTAANPLYQRPKIQWGSQEVVEAMTQSADVFPAVPKAIKNSAGDPFDPPPTRERSLLTLTITRNEHEKQYRPYYAHQFENTTNEFKWQLGEIDTWLCRSIRAGSEFWQDRVLYYQVTYFFIFRPEGWHAMLVDHGPNYLDDAGKKVRETTNTGLGAGLVLLDGQGKKRNPDLGPFFLAFRKYPQKSFSLLELPDVVWP